MSSTDLPSVRLSIIDLVVLLWRDRIIVIAGVALTSLIGVSYALLATPVYRAEVVMTPAGQRQQSGNLAQLGSLAALAGVSIGSGGNSAAALAVLKSREFAEQFIREMKLERTLVEDFDDPKTKRDIRDAIRRFVLEVRVVSEDKKAGVVTLSIFWEDPEVAAEWANAYVEMLNRRLRDEALDESERNVKFLGEQMAANGVVSMQQSLGRILEAEMQNYMLAKGEAEYAYRIVDRAAAPKLRESPKRTLIVLFSAVFGCALAILVILLRSGFVSLPMSTRATG